MKVKRPSGVVFRELESEGGGVLLRLDTGAYHGLNETGCLIWSLVGDGATVDDLVQRLNATFEDVVPGLRTDVESFVIALVERGLLVAQDQV